MSLLVTLLLLLNSTGLLFCQEKSVLKSVVVIFRHGERTIYEPYPNDPYANISFWPGGYAQLTDRGKIQLYQLGQWFRKYYDVFIPETYSFYDIKVKSTDADRALMSAAVFLAGLYPPVGSQMWNPLLTWQPIPIHTTPTDKDAVIAGGKPCPKYDRLLSQLLNSEEYTNVSYQLRDVFAYISKHTGDDRSSVERLQDLYDVLSIEEGFGYRLPDWTKQVYPDVLKPWHIFGFTTLCHTPALARLKMGPLLNEITKRFRNATKYEDASYHKVRVYSAHETTLGNILTTLGAFNNMSIPYGSAVIFELRKNINKEHFVNILYKNSTNVFPIKLQGCEFNCAFDRFGQILEPVLITEKHWEKECYK